MLRRDLYQGGDRGEEPGLPGRRDIAGKDGEKGLWIREPASTEGWRIMGEAARDEIGHV